MNQNYYTWEISLDKDEEKTVIIKTSYRPVFWIIIIVIILAIIYLYYRDPLTIKKEATEVDRDGDEISRIKIKVHIKNRCNKTLHDVKIVEKIPQIVKVSRDHQPGTLSPDKVYKYHHGHAIKWTLKEIEPHEERILIFELKPLLRLVGSLEMKPTIIEFHNAKGKKNKNYSNKLEVA